MTPDATRVCRVVNRVVVITGATGGVGSALAQVFATDRLVLVGRDPERLAALARRHPGSRTVIADLADPATVGPAVTAALAPAEAVDVLVHNAGVAPRGPVADADAIVWSGALTVNTVAPAVLTAALLPRLRAARGHVVFIGSGQSLAASPGFGAYAASKFALRALADALRAEEAGAGIRVTSLFPGRIATDMQRVLQEDARAPYLPERCIDPATFARAVGFAVDAPPDTHLTEITVRPGRPDG